MHEAATAIVASAEATHPREAPVGVFDSGVGGLTVARAILDQLPNESLVYVGDTAHGPYGPLPLAQVRSHAIRVMDYLVEQGVKTLVIACNSASAAVLRDARERYDVPVVEVIHPAVRRAVHVSRNNHIAVIGTQATVTSGAYQDAFHANPRITVTAQACPRFVEFVEQGITGGPELLAVAHEYLAPVVDSGADTLVLGCTHYPVLSALIQHVVGDDIVLVSSAEETAKDVYGVLSDRDLIRSAATAGSRTFLATGDAASFSTVGARFLGPVVGEVSHAAL